MLNRIRFVFTFALIVTLSVSTLILSVPTRTKACPVVPPPQTLLSLYLRSDVIFVADVANEKDGKILVDEGEYVSVEIIRNLKISSVLKGKPERNFVYTTSEYRDKTTSEDSTDNSEDTNVKELDEDLVINNFQYGYKGASEIKTGERYLFFFTKDPETKSYDLTDYISGYKKLSDPDLNIYEKRIKELGKIVEKKENQLEAITEWVVRCIEEPTTRWDGIFDLRNSFQELEYREDEESVEKKPFVIDAKFYSSRPEIAESLSDSQKERISNIVYSSIQDEIFINDFFFSASTLVKNWDKTRLATYAYSFLQTADTTDFKKTRLIMEYISNVLEDGELNEIISEFPIDEETETTEETVDQKTETVSEPQTTVENSPEIVQNVEKDKDNLSEKTETIETIQTVEKTKSPKLTLAQKRAKILQEFISRYEHLLVRGFEAEETEDEVELAEK